MLACMSSSIAVAMSTFPINNTALLRDLCSSCSATDCLCALGQVTYFPPSFCAPSINISGVQWGKTQERYFFSSFYISNTKWGSYSGMHSMPENMVKPSIWLTKAKQQPAASRKSSDPAVLRTMEDATNSTHNLGKITSSLCAPISPSVQCN